MGKALAIYTGGSELRPPCSGTVSLLLQRDGRWGPESSQEAPRSASQVWYKEGGSQDCHAGLSSDRRCAVPSVSVHTHTCTLTRTENIWRIKKEKTLCVIFSLCCFYLVNLKSVLQGRATLNVDSLKLTV